MLQANGPECVCSAWSGGCFPTWAAGAPVISALYTQTAHDCFALQHACVHSYGLSYMPALRV